MQKRMIDRFCQDFDEARTQGLPPTETFEIAIKRFEEVCGFTPYSNIKSYRAAKWQDTRKYLKRYR